MKFFKLAKRYGARVVFVGTSAFALVPAHAAIDVQGVVDEIEATYAAGGPIPILGSAVLLVIVAIMAFKWVRKAIS